MSKVKVTDTNSRHCRCPQCPVQKESICAAKLSNKYTKIDDLNPENAAQLYCALGKTTCSDFKGSESCLCPTCLVWDENNLRSTYFCIYGDAEKND